jgi:hypothetical protein
MADLQLPGGLRLEQVKPDPTAQQLAPLLQAISNQLDLLIRIECGNKTRASVKKLLDDFDAKVKAQSNGEASG